MATNFPTSLDTLVNPTSTDSQAVVSHADQHANANDAIEALEAKVGINSSAVNTSHDYKLSGVATGDKAVSKTGTETLTNKTLTNPQINFGSDARGDLITRNGSGATVRLPIGTSGQILQASSNGDPEWVANPSASDASTTVKGVVEIATTAEITAGTATGGTGATLVVPASAVGTAGASKLVQFDGTGKYPAADGSAITNLTNPVVYKNGVDTSRAGNASGSTQNIAHGLGKTPKRVKISARWSDGSRGGSANGMVIASDGSYNGTTNSNVNWSMNSAGGYLGTSADNTYGVYLIETTSNQFYQRAVITWDATNIILTWTTNGSLGSANTISLMWEAEA